MNDAVAPAGNGALTCNKCDSWARCCRHILLVIEREEDIPEEGMLGGLVRLPLIARPFIEVKLWLDPLNEDEFVVFWPYKNDPIVKAELGFTTKREGRKVLRSLFLAWLRGQEPTCESEIHTPEMLDAWATAAYMRRGKQEKPSEGQVKMRLLAAKADMLDKDLCPACRDLMKNMVETQEESRRK